MVQFAVFETKTQVYLVAIVEAESQHFAVGKQDIAKSGFIKFCKAKVALFKFTFGKIYPR